MTITNGYISLVAAKRRAGMPVTATVDDGAMERAIEAISRDIDFHCSQHFYQVTEARFFKARWTDRLRFGDFNTLAAAPTEVATDEDRDGTFETVWATGDYQVLCKDESPNQRAGPEKRPFVMLDAVGDRRLPVPSTTGGRKFLVRITGTWGWPSQAGTYGLPTAVVEAAGILAMETFKLKDAPFGAAGLGELGIVRVRDNRAAEIKLRNYTAVPVA